MLNSQDDTTTTAPTTDAPTSPTLAGLLAGFLAARAAELEEQQREEARRELQAREQTRADALAMADDYMRAHFSPPLADALRMTPAVDESALQRFWTEDSAENDQDVSGPGYLLLDLSSADVDEYPETPDDGDDARADPARDERWSLRYDSAPFYGSHWTLHGPNGYRATVHAAYYKAPMDAHLLDAIAGYPGWLAGAERRAKQRAEAQRRKQAEQQAKEEQEERRKRERSRHFQSIAGEDGVSLSSGGPILRAGHHLMMTTLDRRGEDGIMVYSGILESFTDVWLLLTLDGGSLPRYERAQRLIPVARVLDVRPLADVEEEETTAD